MYLSKERSWEDCIIENFRKHMPEYLYFNCHLAVFILLVQTKNYNYSLHRLNIYWILHHEVCNTGITNMKNGNLRAKSNKTELGQKHRCAKRLVTVYNKNSICSSELLHFFFNSLAFFIFLYLVLKIIVLKFSVSLRRIHYVFVGWW